MSRYDDNREQADAEIEAGQEAARKADDALSDAVARQEAAENDVDAANAAGDDAAAQAAADRVNSIDDEITRFTQEFDEAMDEVRRIAERWEL
jgi:archaellum component FlaC